MWDKMRKKFKDILDSYTSENNNEQSEPKPSRSYESDIETRVSFQYPKEKSFKFPMIPDSLDQKEEITTTRKRRQREEQEKDTEKERKRAKKKEEQKQREERISTKPPFRPSEVASPIYGYQPRKSKMNTDSLDIPAFERKEQQREDAEKEKSDTSMQEKKTDPSMEQTDLDRLKQTSNTVVPNPERRRKTAEKEPNSLTSFNEYKEKKEQEKLDPSKKQNNKNEDVRSTSTKAENGQSKKASQKEKAAKSKAASGKKKAKNSVPFNVIMTPRDKKNHQMNALDKGRKREG